MKHLFVILFALSIGSAYSQNQNTFPSNGNVGINTTSPSAKLDVNGNMIVDSSLIVKDSVVVEKDLRTRGKFVVEDLAFFLEQVFMYSNLSVDGNINANNNLSVSNKLDVDGNSTFDGILK